MQDVLVGTTARMVKEAVIQLGVPLVGKPFPLDEISCMDEAFITSISRGLLPVTRIDRIEIGNGKPGEITHRVGACYSVMVLSRLEQI
jgi:branched-subunit amino acid aminotransferase/4-amino-4-deoxychorismate lyase